MTQTHRTVDTCRTLLTKITRSLWVRMIHYMLYKHDIGTKSNKMFVSRTRDTFPSQKCTKTHDFEFKVLKINFTAMNGWWCPMQLTVRGNIPLQLGRRSVIPDIWEAPWQAATQAQEMRDHVTTCCAIVKIPTSLITLHRGRPTAETGQTNTWKMLNWAACVAPSIGGIIISLQMQLIDMNVCGLQAYMYCQRCISLNIMSSLANIFLKKYLWSFFYPSIIVFSSIR